MDFGSFLWLLKVPSNITEPTADSEICSQRHAVPVQTTLVQLVVKCQRMWARRVFGHVWYQHVTTDSPVTLFTFSIDTSFFKQVCAVASEVPQKTEGKDWKILI